MFSFEYFAFLPCQVGGRFAHLTTLLLRDGSLGAGGVAAVCQGLAAAVPSPPLTELDLSGNEVRTGLV
jgi:hypothetical protein